MKRTLTGEALAIRREQEDCAAWYRANWRGIWHPLTGVEPQSFEVAPGLYMIRQWEYLAGPCARCAFVDNYCSWDKRLSVAGPGHRELNRSLCQRCAPEFQEWLRAKPAEIHITAWLDLPDEGLIAWHERRESGVCLSARA